MSLEASKPDGGSATLRDGVWESFHADGGGRRARFHYQAGRLEGLAEVWRRDGTLARRAEFRDDQYAGPLEEFDAAGQLAHSVQIKVPLAPPAIAAPEADEQRWLERLLAGDETVPAASTPAARSLSPAAMALAVARGWGGGKERDEAAADVLRLLVERCAGDSLRERLRELQLERRPRIDSTDLLVRVVQRLGREPEVDGRALSRELIRLGGAGFVMALAGASGPLWDAMVHRMRGGRLDMSGLGLPVLRPEIELLPGMRTLDLSRNQLVGLPDQIAHAFCLETLILAHNRLRSLPERLARLSELRALDLSHNQLSEVPPPLFGLHGLRRLSLVGNPLPADALDQLRTSLPACAVD